MKNKNRIRVLGGILLLLVLFSSAFFLLLPNSEKPQGLQLQDDAAMTLDGGLVTITGHVNNLEPTTYTDLQLTFTLYHDEEIMGEAEASIDHLYGHDSWSYSAFQFFPLDQGINRFELKSLSATKTNEIVQEQQFYEKGEKIEGLSVEEYQDLLGNAENAREMPEK